MMAAVPDQSLPSPGPAIQGGIQDGVAALFSCQAARTPGAPALLWRGDRLSYGALQTRSNRMAQYLRAIGLRPGAVVAVRVDHSFDLVIALLAILKAGGVYLPLDPSYPLARLAQMLDDSAAAMLLTPDAWSAELRRPGQGQPGLRTVCLQAEAPWMAAQPDCPPLPGPDAGDLAYLLYTSGSSGVPKGVVVEHAALVNKLIQPGAWGTVTPRTRSVLVGSAGFDAALAQILLPLVHGGSVVLLDLEDRLDPARLWNALQASGVTVLDCTPSWLAAMLEAPPAGVWLERLVLGGEALPYRLVQRARAAWPGCQIVNAYGPTETCIDALAYALPATGCGPDPVVADTIVPIGHPLPGYELHLRDPHGRTPPRGALGELHIAGAGLARGYWRRPDENAARFMAAPGCAGGRLYRTGDLVRQRADGAWEFHGRIDQQVKLRGQRLELEEIANVLRQHPSVADAAVALVAPGDGEPMLVAYVVPGDGPGRRTVVRCTLADRPPVRRAMDDSAIAALRAHAAARLPPFMVPARWMVLRAMPLTPAGKLDRAALPAPAAPPRLASAGTIVPTDATEQAIAAVWAESLGLPQVATDDNFFELGGHSLLAATVLGRLNRQLHTRLPLAAFFQNPTVADLAIAMARHAQGRDRGRLVQLSRPGPAVKLFCVPPLSGMGTVYAGLGRFLAGSVQVFALQATGLTLAPPGGLGMEDLAAAFIADIRNAQPAGPYHLCGYSAGGAVAQEMCRQLATAGEQVAALILLDPYIHEPDPDDSETEAGCPDEAFFWDACRELLGDMGLKDGAADPAIAVARLLWSQILCRPPGEAARIEPDAALLDRAEQALAGLMSPELFLLMLEGTRNTWSAYCGYAARPLAQPPLASWMVQPQADAPPLRADRLARWRSLIGPGLAPLLVPGEHTAMLAKSQSVGVLAEQIAQCLADPAAMAAA